LVPFNKEYLSLEPIACYVEGSPEIILVPGGCVGKIVAVAEPFIPMKSGVEPFITSAEMIAQTCYADYVEEEHVDKRFMRLGALAVLLILEGRGALKCTGNELNHLLHAMHAEPGMFDMRSSNTETTFDDKDMVVSMATKHYNRFSESTLSSRQLDATSQENEIDDKIPLIVPTEQEEYWNYASGVFQNRRAFVTDNGLLGHGPDIAEPRDPDLTYKYTKFLYARPLVYYPFLIFVILVAQSGFTIDMLIQHTGVYYPGYEYGWHPDVKTGLSISQADGSTYPDNYIPRLNALISTVFMQLLVEISPMIQTFLSLKPFQWVFPHIFTVYLIHGFIFWSIGSLVCINLFAAGVPYWACVLVVFVICYGTLIGSMPILTPIVEIVGKNVTQSLWEHASQEPAPRKKTLYPFGPDIFDKPAAVCVMGTNTEKSWQATGQKDVIEKKNPSVSVSEVRD
jgi:hypothetical protein